MDTAAMILRVNQLWISQRDELAIKTQNKRRKIVQESANRGMIHSTTLIQLLAELYTENLRAAAPAAWDLLQETHSAMGGDTTPETRIAMKSWMSEKISELKSGASAQIKRDLDQYGRGLQNKGLIEQIDNSESIANSLNSRYGVIVDNYLDHLVNNPTTRSPITINAQNIGAVLTGDRAKANITQNMDAAKEMRDLVELMREVLKHDAGLDPLRKTELIEIADDTRTELDKTAPNETKLMTLFTLLTQSAQTLPAAKPAYDAAKNLLATFGINLP
ncbi:MAG: hypothetical protein ACO1PN_10855 [Betaproteobacteria bacterium]